MVPPVTRITSYNVCYTKLLRTLPTTAHTPLNAWYMADVSVQINESDPLAGSPTPIASGVAITRYCIDTVLVGAPEPVACDPFGLSGIDLAINKLIPVAQAANTANDHYVHYASRDVAGNQQATQTALVRIDA